MKTSSLMMCALVALTACGTGVKQSVRTPVEMGERIELKTPDPKMGLTINEALAARSSSRDFSPEMLSLEELSGVLWAAEQLPPAGCAGKAPERCPAAETHARYVQHGRRIQISL